MNSWLRMWRWRSGKTPRNRGLLRCGFDWFRRTWSETEPRICRIKGLMILRKYQLQLGVRRLHDADLIGVEAEPLWCIADGARRGYGEQSEGIVIAQTLEQRGRGLDHQKPFPFLQPIRAAPLATLGVQDRVLARRADPKRPLENLHGIILDLGRGVALRDGNRWFVSSDSAKWIHQTPANPSQQNEERNTKEFEIFHKKRR